MKLLAYKLIAAALLLACAWGAYEGWATHERDIGRDAERAVWTATVAKQKAEATAKLAAETEKTRAAEAKLGAALSTLEAQDADHRKTVAGYETRLRTAAATGRLRDPNAEGCGGGSRGPANPPTAVAGNSTNDTPQTGGVFSAAATRLLLQLTREADEVNVAYASCREDSINLRAP